MVLVEIVWSRKRLGNSSEEYFMEHLKSFPTISILHLVLCNLLYIECISAELRLAQKEIWEKIITLWTSSAGLTFFIYILSCALDVRYRKVPLSQIVWGCFRPFESWLRSEANSHFKQRECCMSRSIHRTGPKPALSSHQAGCWLLWSSHWTVIFHATCTTRRPLGECRPLPRPTVTLLWYFDFVRIPISWCRTSATLPEVHT